MGVMLHSMNLFFLYTKVIKLFCRSNMVAGLYLNFECRLGSLLKAQTNRNF